MDFVYRKSIPVIQTIQTRFEEQDTFLNAINQVADPAYTISIIFPILCTFDTLLAADILMVTVISEWSNILIKWFVSEDRPFWWVRETNVIQYYLKQGPLTCETSPGSPSGHLMGFASVLYVIVSSCIKYYCAKNNHAVRTFKNDNNKHLKIAFWTVYTVALIFVSIARIYAATHFPHQCLLGAILGFLIGHYFGNSNKSLTTYWHNGTRLRMLSLVLIATCISFAAYWTQKALGIDPQWSVKMAFKWCEHIDNIHVNTTPLYSLVRDTGLGIGIAAVSPVTQRAPRKHNLMVSVACVLFFCTCLHLAQTAVPTYDAKIFYICHMFLSVTLSYVLLSVMPKLATIKRKIS